MFHISPTNFFGVLAMAPMKVMKNVMKATKSSKPAKGKSMKLNKKNLKALPGGPTPMPLEEKIEMYQKKGCNNIDNFLSSLTTRQREALWQKFNYDRKADPKLCRSSSKGWININSS